MSPIPISSKPNPQLIPSVPFLSFQQCYLFLCELETRRTGQEDKLNFTAREGKRPLFSGNGRVFALKWNLAPNPRLFDPLPLIRGRSLHFHDGVGKKSSLAYGCQEETLALLYYHLPARRLTVKRDICHFFLLSGDSGLGKYTFSRYTVQESKIPARVFCKRDFCLLSNSTFSPPPLLHFWQAGRERPPLHRKRPL